MNERTRHALSVLDSHDHVRLVKSVREAEKLEDNWKKKFQAFYDSLSHRAIEAMMSGEGVNEIDCDFTQIVMHHYFDCLFKGVSSVSDVEYFGENRLAKKVKKPKFKDVTGMFRDWELWKSRGKVPARQRSIAQNLEKSYMKKLREIWKDLESGEKIQKAEVVGKIQRAAKTGTSRASTIVQTETTSHFNQARRDIYDTSPDITHYLFLAIRDKATTKWCLTRTGLVYKKGDPLTDKETPAIHWNCRSEMLPLSPLNPKHQKLIDDDKLKRRNHSCEPLPKGWVK